MDDLLQLIIYIAIGLIGVLASAYKNKQKAQQRKLQQQMPQVPRNLPADPGQDFGPELGPLMELFDIPRQAPAQAEYETIESGPGAEEGGMNVDTAVSSAELAGMTLEAQGIPEKEAVSEVETFEEGQSDIQKLIAKYEAIQKELDVDSIGDNIAHGQIVSADAETGASRVMIGEERFFDPRKAIIYAEILKRREY